MGDERVRVEREASLQSGRRRRRGRGSGAARSRHPPRTAGRECRAGAGASASTSGNAASRAGAEAWRSSVGASSVTTMPQPARRTVTTSVSPSATARITRRSPGPCRDVPGQDCIARATGSACARTAFGLPRGRAATTARDPELHALRADETEASAARCAASFRRSVSARASRLPAAAAAVRARRRWTSSRAAPPGWTRASRSGRWPAASAGSAPGCGRRARRASPPATSSAATARRRQSSARPLFVRVLFAASRRRARTRA